MGLESPLLAHDLDGWHHVWIARLVVCACRLYKEMDSLWGLSPPGWPTTLMAGTRCCLENLSCGPVYVVEE